MDDKCPITLTQISQAIFRPFGNMDWEAFAGCEGESPQITEIDNYIVVVDEAEDTTNIQVHEVEGGSHVWNWEISTQPEQLN